MSYVGFLRQLHSLKVSRRESLNDRRSLRESRAENTIGILEHAVLQRHNNELRALESSLDEAANILGV